MTNFIISFNLFGELDFFGDWDAAEDRENEKRNAVRIKSCKGWKRWDQHQENKKRLICPSSHDFVINSFIFMSEQTRQYKHTDNVNNTSAHTAFKKGNKRVEKRKKNE